MILTIKHVDIEGPETIGTFFEKHGYRLKSLELYNGEIFPKSLKGIDAVICLGGPMNVYEEEKYPFLADENVFIQQVLKEQIPYLGICLGSQLLSKASGGRVTRSPAEEIGWRTVQLTFDGQNDPLFKNINKDFLVYQWHGDMFSVPPSGCLLATGPDCPQQALKVGKNAYGIQFHIEITDKSIREWSDEYFRNSPSLLSEKKAMMLQEYAKVKAGFEKTAETIYANFLNIIENTNH